MELILAVALGIILVPVLLNGLAWIFVFLHWSRWFWLGLGVLLCMAVLVGHS